MSDFTFVILYVKNPAASAKFYTELLNQPIVEQMPNFAMLPLREGVMLGLWARHDVEPSGAMEPGGSEIFFSAKDRDAVQAKHDEWKKHGVKIAQAPVQKDFGFTFLALDPDNHRLRVSASAKA